MSHAGEILDAAPKRGDVDPAALAAAIDTCAAAAQTCTSYADACLTEQGVAALHTCIVLDTDCADVCAVIARVLSREREDNFLVHRLLQARVRVGSSCEGESARRADHHRHCAICAQVCRACEHACRQILEADAFEELQALAGG